MTTDRTTIRALFILFALLLSASAQLQTITGKVIGVKPTATAASTGPIVGNRNGKIYHLPNCQDYSKVSEKNRVPFKTEAEAQVAGYSKARNCP